MIRTSDIKWLENLNNNHTHGKNILAKIRGLKEFSGPQKRYLENALVGYKEFFDSVHTNSTIESQVEALNKYKKLIHGYDFSAQSKFHSSILEEFSHKF